jgi:hypothetical protein
MLTPKPISRESIPRALAKAERYRLLNEPMQADSICRDVLAVEPESQGALACLILSLTDMFAGGEAKIDDARPIVQRLTSEFERLYYAGVIQERWALALLHTGYEAAGVYRWFASAMTCYEQANPLAPEGNDDAVLRWNACARLVERHQLDVATSADASDGADLESLDDDVPMR